jgi:hypothetical protein
MSVQLSKAIMCAAMEVQSRGQALSPLVPHQTTLNGDKEVMSPSGYHKCRKRIRALESAVEELRRELKKQTQAIFPMEQA